MFDPFSLLNINKRFTIDGRKYNDTNSSCDQCADKVDGGSEHHKNLNSSLALKMNARPIFEVFDEENVELGSTSRSKSNLKP